MQKIRKNSRRHFALLASVIALPFLAPSLASAQDLTPDEYRVTRSIGKFDSVTQFAIAYRFDAPEILRASRTELSFGTFSSREEDRPYVSFGAVWRVPPKWVPLPRDSMFVDVGFSPTIIAGSSLNGRDLGGSVHFTSSIEIGALFGREQSTAVSLRLQHTSNGGLNSTNPGIDTLGFNFAFNFE